MSSALGLNEHHQGNVVNYIRFARFQRSTQLRAIDACFENIKDSRLTESMFTADEVSQLFDDLLSVVRSDVETELLNMAHTNVLVMRQLFTQAEKWHLKLQADISELENREMLEKIKEFEEREMSNTLRDDFKVSAPKLQPLNETGQTALLTMKINELEDENDTLRSRLKTTEGQAVSLQQQKRELQEDLAKVRKEFGSAKSAKPSRSSESDDMQGEVERVRLEMERTRAHSKSSNEAMESDLVSTKHRLLEIQAQMEMAEKELEKKFSQTGAYKNLKTMLQKKNDQLKDLRRRLSKYEDADDDDR